ncbi:MAG: Iron-binding protein IscA [Wolbachia endosymbiont of Ctenocephalides orientis wCori]|nr:MAG: Iron-binding protein IscA [Wolbachia endosymbiont of Ctenocephalides orientis wCori]
MSEYQRVNKSEVVKNDRKPITITANAVKQVRHLLDKKNNNSDSTKKLEEDDEGYGSEDDNNDSDGVNAIGIRVLIKQKGCSGLKYDIEYAYDVRPLESIVEESCDDGQKIKVLIDPRSVMFILGSEMDYIEEKFSSGFVFNNPNEKGKCGCGESFHV